MARIVQAYTQGRNELVVRMDGLGYYNEKKMHFVLIWKNRDVSFTDSDNTSGEANVIFNISSVSEGNQYFMVKRIMEGSGSRFTVGDFTKYIGGGSIIVPDDPPNPPPERNHEMSYIHINRFNEDEDGYLEVQVTTDGYGEVDLVSVTKAYDLYRSDGTKTDKHIKLASSRIYESELRNGMYEGTLIFRFEKTDLSYFPSVPAGTCHLASGARGWLQSSYDVYSKEFMCLSEYRRWQKYEGMYYAELTNATNGYNVSATRLSTVSEDWKRVVNMAFYLEATVHGNIKYSTYRAYIPSGGEILTANMYNSLIDAVRESCQRVGSSTYELPSYVSSGDIIPSHFLYVVGRTIDRGLIKQKNDANRRAIW